MLFYAKNFRGFGELRIDIEKNIFLVGDNSSGKTSIIYLLEYITRTDLNGLPILMSDFNVGKYDFFSPYFDHADVTIGFSAKEDDREIYRVITLRKLKKAYSAAVIKSTSASQNRSITLRQGEGIKECSIVERDGLTFDQVLEIHGDPNAVFTEYKDGFDRVPVNFPQSVLNAVGDDKDNIQDWVDISFASPLPNCRHIGPMRAMPENFYQMDRQFHSTGSHFAIMMRDVESAPNKNKSKSSIRKFGKESGLFQDFKVKTVSASIGNPLLNVVVKKNNREFLINQVGIGVSQVAPILAETQAFAHGIVSSSLILIEQPELHLHPIAQAALGEYLWEMTNFGLRFVIETHSDYLIDRYRAKIKESKGKNSAMILYCTNGPDGNTASEVEIADDGKLVGAPKSYHQFFLNEMGRTIF